MLNAACALRALQGPLFLKSEGCTATHEKSLHPEGVHCKVGLASLSNEAGDGVAAGSRRLTRARCRPCALCWAPATMSRCRWTCSRRCTASSPPTPLVGQLNACTAQPASAAWICELCHLLQATRAARCLPPAVCMHWCDPAPGPQPPAPGPRSPAPHDGAYIALLKDT